MGWGSSTRRGGGRKLRARPRNFVFLGFRREESGMSREFCRDVPDPWRCSKSLCKKTSCAFFVPYKSHSYVPFAANSLRPRNTIGAKNGRLKSMQPLPQYWIKFLDTWLQDFCPVLGWGLATLRRRARLVPASALDKKSVSPWITVRVLAPPQLQHHVEVSPKRYRWQRPTTVVDLLEQPL